MFYKQKGRIDSLERTKQLSSEQSHSPFIALAVHTNRTLILLREFPNVLQRLEKQKGFATPKREQLITSNRPDIYEEILHCLFNARFIIQYFQWHTRTYSALKYKSRNAYILYIISSV